MNSAITLIKNTIDRSEPGLGHVCPDPQPETEETDFACPRS